MASHFAENAVEAFMNNDYKLAIDLYSTAIHLDSSNADCFDGRAHAYIKVQKFIEAFADANKAIELDPSLVTAYLHKGTACMKLKAYEAAKAALEMGASYSPGDRRFTKLITDCENRIAAGSQPPIVYETQAYEWTQTLVGGLALSTGCIFADSKKIEDSPSEPLSFSRGNFGASLPHELREHRQRRSRKEGVPSSTTRAPPRHHDVGGVKD